jgi:L-lactate dehydrogenase complex protein LldE
MRVMLFTTCLTDVYFPQTASDVIRLLGRFGVETFVPRGRTCCGKPAHSAGYTEAARAAARHFLRLFDGVDPIVIPSGSCASMVKNHYPHLFESDASMRALAEDTASRVFELSEFLVHRLRAHEAGLTGRGKITYHASCQLTRELGVRDEPPMLLNSLSGAEFLPMPYADRCCGFGGLFMAKLPEVSMAMADDKVETILSTGADTVTGCDHGCLMNIRDGLKRAGSSVRAVHLVSLLVEGL